MEDFSMFFERILRKIKIESVLGGRFWPAFLFNLVFS